MIIKKIIHISIPILFLLSMKVHSNELVKSIYKDPYFLYFNSHYYRNDAIDEKGCSIQNQRNKHFQIIDQILCSHAIAHGIGSDDESHIRKGISAISYGFKIEYDNGIFKSTSIAHASRFLFAVVLCYLDISKINTTMSNEYRKEFETNISKIKDIAYWIKNSEQLEKDMAGIKKSANQMISLGILYVVIGELTNDNELQTYGHGFLESGIAMQTEEGIFLENGGFDSSYQAFNLLLISYLYLYFDDISLHRKAYTMLQKGWKYELNYISSNGKTSVLENTRTGRKQEMWRGKYKPVNYPEVAISLIYWSYISNNERLRELSQEVFNYGLKKRER